MMEIWGLEIMEMQKTHLRLGNSALKVDWWIGLKQCAGMFWYLWRPAFCK